MSPYTLTVSTHTVPKDYQYTTYNTVQGKNYCLVFVLACFCVLFMIVWSMMYNIK